MKTNYILYAGAGGVILWYLWKKYNAPVGIAPVPPVPAPAPVASVSGGEVSDLTYNGAYADLNSLYKKVSEAPQTYNAIASQYTEQTQTVANLFKDYK